MTALSFLDHLRRCGFDLRLRGDSLIVSPASQLTERDRDLVRLHKPALALILAGQGPAPGALIYWCPDRSTVLDPATRKRVPVRPRWWTWEGAPEWYRCTPPDGVPCFPPEVAIEDLELWVVRRQDGREEAVSMDLLKDAVATAPEVYLDMPVRRSGGTAWVTVRDLGLYPNFSEGAWPQSP